MKKTSFLIITFIFSFSLFAQKSQRVVLFEEFTSATCGPCAGFNIEVFNDNFVNSNDGKLTIIKYQMNWPGSGDAYYTPEGGTRRNFYGINGVPSLFIDGNELANTPGTSVSQLQSKLDNAYAIPANYDITGAFQINQNEVSVQTNINAYESRDKLKMFIVVVEKTTTGNVGINGETEFTNVMMKMYPSANGMEVGFTENSNYCLSAKIDMEGTNVEEMDDLAVVIFIQDPVTKEILQSAYAEETTELPTPIASTYPGDGNDNASPDNPFFISFNQPLTLANGDPITNENLSSFVHVTAAEDKEEVNVNMTINEEKTIITIMPAENAFWSELTEYTISIDENVLGNSDNENLPSFTSTFMTSEYPTQTLMFTPADGSQNVSVSTEFIRISFEHEINQADGTPHTASTLENVVILRDSDGNELSKSLAITPDRKMLYLVPDEDLPANSNITFGIKANAIANKYGVLMGEQTATFVTANSTSVKVFDESLFTIYPNPAQDFMKLEMPLDFGTQKIEIKDVLGRTVFEKAIDKDEKTIIINTQSFSKGLYFNSFISEDNSKVTKKFTIVH